MSYHVILGCGVRLIAVAFQKTPLGLVGLTTKAAEGCSDLLNAVA